MERCGSITAGMRQAGDQFATCILTGSRPALLLLGSLGIPVSSCLVHVLGLGWPLRQWAQGAWQGRPIDDETAAGVLIAALGAVVNGDARLLLDAALAAAAQRGAAA